MTTSTTRCDYCSEPMADDAAARIARADRGGNSAYCDDCHADAAADNYGIESITYAY